MAFTDAPDQLLFASSCWLCRAVYVLKQSFTEANVQLHQIPTSLSTSQKPGHQPAPSDALVVLKMLLGVWVTAMSTWHVKHKQSYGRGDQVFHSCFNTAFNSGTSYNLRHPQTALLSMMQTHKVCLKNGSVPLSSFPLSLPPNLQRSWSPH